MAKKNTDYRDGGNEVFKRLQISVNEGNLTPEAFIYELNAWQNDQYEEVKTKMQVDTSDIASNSAQIREFTKAVNQVSPALKEMNDALASVGLKAVPLA